MIYQIKDWNGLFEKAQTRKCAGMNWVAVPNRHDGTGYATVAAHLAALRQQVRTLLADLVNEGGAG